MTIKASVDVGNKALVEASEFVAVENTSSVAKGFKERACQSCV